MNHLKYKENLQLHLWEELHPEEEKELAQHLLNCEECRHELSELKRVFNTITLTKPSELDEKELRQVRNKTIRTVRMIDLKKFSLHEFVKYKILPLYDYKTTKIAAAILFFVCGFVLSTILINKSMSDFGGTSLDNLQVSGINFPINSSNLSEVELTYNSETNNTYKGSLDNPKTQNLILTALKNNENKNLKALAFNAVANADIELLKNNESIKACLMDAVLTDESMPVRLKALNTLMKFEPDKDLIDTYLVVLNQEKNSAMRILAIQALDLSAGKINSKTLEVIADKSINDENPFVRSRAASIVEKKGVKSEIL